MKHAIFYDWGLDPRMGGPTGYLSILLGGLERIGARGEIDLIGPSDDQTPARKSPDPVFAGLDLYSEAEDFDAFARQAARNRIDKTSLYLSDLRNFRVRIAHEQAFLKNRYRTVHAHTTIDALKIHFSLVRLGLRHATKIILSSHCPELPAKEWSDLAFDESGSGVAADQHFHNYRFIDKLAFIFADLLIFPCESALEPYRASLHEFDHIFAHKPILYVASGSFEMPVSETRDEVRSRLGLGDRFVCAYIGRHSAVKGYDRLKAVAAELLDERDDIAFLIGGKQGPIAAPDRPGWIEYGWTATPGDLVKASDVFVLPNRQTYFDLVMLEVLAAGVPVIASNTGGNRAFKGRSDGIMLFDDDAALKREILRLQGLSEDCRRELGGRNKALYDAEFTPEAFAKRYLDAVREAQDWVCGGVRMPVVASDARNRPKVSVIVPVYNVEGYVRQCVDSVLAQSFKDYEVIIVDDGSTDGSSKLLERYKRNRRVRIVRQKNQGLSAARNTGLEYALGDYVAFIDSDDYLERDFLKRLYQAAVANDADLAVCAIAQIWEDKQKPHSTVHPGPDVEIRKEGDCLVLDPFVVSSLFPSAWNKLYRRSLFEDVKYNHGFFYEDNPVFYHLFLGRDAVPYVEEPLYLHRMVRSGKITSMGNVQNIQIFYILGVVYGELVSQAGAQVAQTVIAKLLTRLAWERSWSVRSEVLRFELAQLYQQYAHLFGLGRDELIRCKDAIVDGAFIDDQLALANSRGGEAAAAKHLWHVRSRTVLADRTKDRDAYPFELVRHDDGGDYIVVHPHLDGVTVAEIAGLGRYGRRRLAVNVCIENEAAPDIEFSIWSSPYRVLHPSVFVRDDAQGLVRTQWLRLSPQAPAMVELDVEQSTALQYYYFCSRLPEGVRTMDFAWLHVRNIVVANLADGAGDDGA